MMEPENIATQSAHSAADQSLEAALGQVLRAGVVFSVLITLAGAVLLLLQDRGANGRELIAQQGQQLSVSAIFHGAFHGEGPAVILLGLMVLLATPVFRVASMIVAFAWEKDWRYAAISAAVLCVLVFGIFLAR